MAFGHWKDTIQWDVNDRGGWGDPNGFSHQPIQAPSIPITLAIPVVGSRLLAVLFDISGLRQSFSWGSIFRLPVLFEIPGFIASPISVTDDRRRGRNKRCWIHEKWTCVQADEEIACREKKRSRWNDRR